MKNKLSRTVYIPPSFLKKVREVYTREEAPLIKDEGTVLVIKLPYGAVLPSSLKE